MATFLYCATMSLDGFIAGPGGDMSWLTPHLGHPNPTADDVLARTGCILAGNRTFRGDDPHLGTPKEGAYEGRYRGPQVVLTHHVPERAWPGVTFATDLAGAVEAAGRLAGDTYVNVLGADVARQCLAAGVLDEVLMLVAPVLLGDGVRVFQHPGGTDVRLARIHPTELWFRVLR